MLRITPEDPAQAVLMNLLVSALSRRAHRHEKPCRPHRAATPLPPTSRTCRTMSSLAAEDVATLRKIGRDTIMNIVALCVEAVLYSERNS